MREQLMTLIIDAKRTDPETGSFTEYLVDYLIANGVTVQRWIPCTERLPEHYMLHVEEDLFEPMDFNVMIQGAELPTTLCFDGKEWRSREGDVYEVACWQPLPEPPGKDVGGNG